MQQNETALAPTAAWFLGRSACVLAAARAADPAILEVPAGYATIQAAVNAAGPGDTVEVSTGTYAEFVSFPSSGTPGNPITLAAKAGHTPVIDGTGLATTDVDGLVFIDNRSYITVTGMEIANLSASSPGHFPAGIWVRGTSHHIEIVGNTVHGIANAGCSNCGAHGIAAYGTSASGSIHDLLIDGNEVYDCVLGWSESVVVNGNVEDFKITNNVVHDNNNIGIDAIGFEGECSGCSSALDQARDGLIGGNYVYNIDSIGNPSYGGERSADGIYVDGGARIVIERNVVHDSNIGIELASEYSGKAMSEVLVRNNFVYRSHSIRIAIGGYDNHRGSTRDCAIVHNTLYDNDTDYSTGGELLVQYDTRDNLIENNIVVANSQNQFIANEWTATSGNVIDHNLYFIAGGAAASKWVWKTTPYTGFASWKSGSGNDANSTFADPVLVSPATGDGYDANCTVTGCGNGIATAGEDCDDGNLAGGDCCSALCLFESDGSACDDGEQCTFEDSCDGGCAGAAQLEPACLVPDAGRTGSQLKLRGSGSSSDRLTWKWGKGPAADLSTFGSPVATDNYVLCVFADDGVQARVLLSARAASGSGWASLGSRGFKYSRKDLLPDGLKQIQLKPGDAGRARLKAKGQGVGLGMATLGFGASTTVSVELRNLATGACFGAFFTSPFRRDDAGSFQDGSD